MREVLYDLAKTLFPINRSITGDGVRQSLNIIKDIIPISIQEVPSETNVFDWVIPYEWNIKSATIKNTKGETLVDFSDHNLHIMGYSEPIDRIVSHDELMKHLYYLEDKPDWIPYITSYYKKDWGFCVKYSDISKFNDSAYYVKIDSTLKPGSLTYAELILKGKTDKEILVSTNICHPSMGNNEISGPVLTTYLAKHIMQKDRYYSYRFVFIPETIGAITYISRHLSALRNNVVAGYTAVCVGDKGKFSYLKSKDDSSLVNRLSLHVLRHSEREFNTYEFLDRGSDERQYCWPGVNIPVGSLMRTKYAQYPEYHTSGDDLNFISASALEESLDKYKLCLDMLDANRIYICNTLCEPQLGKRGMYPTTSTINSINIVRDIRNVLVYCDGHNDVLTIAERMNKPMWEILPIVNDLLLHNLIGEV